MAVVAVMLLASSSSAAQAQTAANAAATGWTWPVTEVKVARAYLQPEHEYATGHRGIDLFAETALAPADGVVAFAGTVAGRPLLTIEHADGYVTTLEPVVASVSVGDPVTRGQPVGDVALGGHAQAGTLHFGVRLNGEYINPARLLGSMPRAVLLPCCDP